MEDIQTLVNKLEEDLSEDERKKKEWYAHTPVRKALCAPRPPKGMSPPVPATQFFSARTSPVTRTLHPFRRGSPFKSLVAVRTRLNSLHDKLAVLLFFPSSLADIFEGLVASHKLVKKSFAKKKRSREGDAADGDAAPASAAADGEVAPASAAADGEAAADDDEVDELFERLDDDDDQDEDDVDANDELCRWLEGDNDPPGRGGGGCSSESTRADVRELLARVTAKSLAGQLLGLATSLRNPNHLAQVRVLYTLLEGDGFINTGVQADRGPDVDTVQRLQARRATVTALVEAPDTTFFQRLEPDVRVLGQAAASAYKSKFDERVTPHLTMLEHRALCDVLYLKTLSLAERLAMEPPLREPTQDLRREWQVAMHALTRFAINSELPDAFWLDERISKPLRDRVLTLRARTLSTVPAERALASARALENKGRRIAPRKFVLQWRLKLYSASKPIEDLYVRRHLFEPKK